jgi:two-component system, OmpR family, sensor kinase
MTAAFALAMVVVIAGTALFVYLRLRTDLYDSVDAGLRSRSDDVAALIRGSDASLAQAGRGQLAESEESFAQVLTPNGRFVDGTGVRASALSPDDARRASEGPRIFERKVGGIEGTARMLARPVATAHGLRIVVTGASLQDSADTLKGLITSFLIFGPIAVLLASGAGYVLATVGFRPVEAMRRRATHISLSRGGERLPLPDARDEIRRLGETLNEMLDRMEASFERERQFVADASHELRTPVAVLKAELEAAIRSKGDDTSLRESLVAALEETDHLAQLAEDLLLIARAGDGLLPVSRAPADIGELLERTRDRFSDRAREQGREIRVDVSDDLRASLDPVRVRQALGNLVDNALRHGAGKIRISARQVGAAVEIDVGDEGPGFPSELAPRAFERFARGAATRTGSGAGLGLAIVRAIAEAHGGTATIVERATVRLHIPLAAESADGRPLSSPFQVSSQQ